MRHPVRCSSSIHTSLSIVVHTLYHTHSLTHILSVLFSTPLPSLHTRARELLPTTANYRQLLPTPADEGGEDGGVGGAAGATRALPCAADADSCVLEHAEASNDGRCGFYAGEGAEIDLPRALLHTGGALQLGGAGMIEGRERGRRGAGKGRHDR